MRKVMLTMDENEKYITIKKLVEISGSKERAAVHLNCTVRHVNRMIKGYKEKGKEFFVHGNKGRKPVHTLEDETRKKVLDFYRTKYEDANFVHYSELLEENEHIKVSPSTIRSILIEENIISPKAKRTTRKNLVKKLNYQMKITKSKKEVTALQNAIINIEDAHPRRPRCAYFGEVLQMDASLHNWFGKNKSQLHLAVDDATGNIVGAYFDNQETLNGYYNVLYQVLTQYGIPYMLYTDRRTVFEYTKKKSPSVEEDTFTQFGYACKQFGIEIKSSSVAQAKGRVERMFQTLQSRLVIELRLAGISTIDQANEFLNSYIKKFNKQFALPIDNIKSVFENQPYNEKINLTLAILAERKIDNGHCIKYEKRYFKLLNSNGNPVYYYKGTHCMVIKAFDGQLFGCINEQVFALEEIPTHQRSSKNFDFKKLNEKPKKKYIPPMSHPWKRSSFEKYLESQSHRAKKVS
jgi:transposase